ncbi:uncharacterized protein LKV04_015961 [Tautogolabrus adspersus]
MADKLPLPRLLVTARPDNQEKKRKTEAEKAVTRRRFDQTRVNIGTAFQRWRQLRELKGLRSDAMVALFLMDSYEKQTSTPWKPGLLRPPPPAGSAVAAESLSDLDDDLSEAPEETFELFEKRIAEYEEELRHLKEENERKQKLLDAVFNPEVRLHRAEVQQLLLGEEEVPPEQKERSSSLDQEDPPEPPHIKEDQEELWSSQEREQLQEPEAAHISMFVFTPVPVKREDGDDVEKPQTSQLHEIQTEESRDTQHSETEAGGEDCGGSGADRDFNPHILVQSVTHEQTSHSDSEDNNSLCDWEETFKTLSIFNPLQNTSLSSSECHVCRYQRVCEKTEIEGHAGGTLEEKPSMGGQRRNRAGGGVRGTGSAELGMVATETSTENSATSTNPRRRDHVRIGNKRVTREEALWNTWRGEARYTSPAA